MEAGAKDYLESTQVIPRSVAPSHQEAPSANCTAIILQALVLTRSNEVMSQAVKVSELKAKLSGYLAQLRRGGTVTVCDRKTPIARLVPVGDQTGGLIVREAIDPEGPLPRRRIRLKKRVDVVEMLCADRANR